MHPAYYTPLAPYPNFRLPESSIGFNAELAMDNWEKGENAACQYWAKARVVGKEGDAPWNKLHHRIIPLWKDFGLKNYVSQTVHSGTINDTLVCQLPYNAQIMPYMELEAEKAHPIITIILTLFLRIWQLKC